MRTKKTSRIYRTGIKGLLINNDLCFVENNISQLTQNFRLANKIKVLLVFERYQLPIKELYLCCQECYAYSTLKNKLDYQVSICSLIPPATAISKTQDKVDMSVWWKLPFSIFFIIYYVQSTIINKVYKPELWFLRSAHPIIVLYVCMKFHENISNNF